MKLRSIATFVALVAATTATTTLISSLSRSTAAPEAAGPIYAQLSSAVTQKPETGPLLVAMESNDALAGIGHSDKDKTNEVTVKTAGVYFLMAAAQVGKETGDADEFVDLWIKQNGKDVDNSNTRQQIKDSKFTTVLVCQGIAECKAGDVINVALASSSPGKGLGIQATKPKGEPVIPSVIFSMYKIN